MRSLDHYATRTARRLSRERAFLNLLAPVRTCLAGAGHGSGGGAPDVSGHNRFGT